MSVDNLIDQALALSYDTTLEKTSFKFIKNLLKDDESEKVVANRINKQLQNHSTELYGSKLLNFCLPVFSEQIYYEFGPFWVRCCLYNIKNGKQQEFELELLRNIIENSRHYSKFKRIFLNEFLHETLQTLLVKTANSNINEVSLNCLTSCLKQHSNFCKSYRTEIEKYILGFANSQNKELTTASGLAFAFCQEIGNFKDNMTLSIRKLCATCLKYFDLILKNDVEFMKNCELKNIPPFHLEAIPFHYDCDLKLNYEVQIVKNCVSWIKILLQKNGSKIIYPQEILNFIHRGTSLSDGLDGSEPILKSISMHLHLKEIQSQCLQLLETLIIQIGPLLTPFYNKIMKIIFEIFEKNRSSRSNSDSLILEQVFRVLSTWLIRGRSGLHQSLQEKMISSIIHDAFPPENLVSLKIDTNLVGKSLKKKNKYLHNKMTTEESIEDSYSSHQQKLKLTTSLNALNMLKFLLDHTPLSIKKNLLNKLIASLMNALSDIQKGKLIFPFNDTRCQLLLYEIVCSMYEQDSIESLPPVQIIINALQNGCKHENQQIVTLCSKCLLTLERICQPVSSSEFHCNDLNSLIETTHMETLITTKANLEPNVDASPHIIPGEVFQPSCIDKIKPKITILYDVIIPETSEKVIETHQMETYESKKDQEVSKEKQDVSKEKQEECLSVSSEDMERNELNMEKINDNDVDYGMTMENDAPFQEIDHLGTRDSKDNHTCPEVGLNNTEDEIGADHEMLDSFLDIVNDDYE